MKRNKLWIITVSLVFMMAFGALAQKSKPQKPAKKPAAAEVKKPAPAANALPNEEKVRDLVAFLQLLLNTLGSSSSSTRDKDVVITESYTKIFRDGKVQVEDDLDDKRNAITNKDVVAYLKDVDFFFQDVSFEFVIEKIEEGVNANGQPFYKVSLQRNLTGVTASGKTVSNTIPRYIEVNYDPEEEDLKIASIYTNEFDEKEALTNWWSQLSFEWQTIFKRKLNIVDSVDLNDIKDMKSINELDISGNSYIQSLEPLAQLINLRLLNLAETNVEDLTPIRNLTELVELNLSKTKVFDLSPLKYATRLARLNINNTEIRSIAVVEKMTSMQNLEMKATHVLDFAPLAALTHLLNLDLEQTLIADLSPVGTLTGLMELNVSKTHIQDLSPLGGVSDLVTLNIDSTLVRDVTALKALEKLEVLYANYTSLSDLSPLSKLPKLERVYCDQTSVNQAMADAFMRANPDVLIIYDSKDLQAWWKTLSLDWQQLLSKTAGIRLSPGKEELARVTNLDSINVSNNRSISSLEPLRRLQKLEAVVAANTPVNDLSPLEEHREVRYIDISDTEVQSLTPLNKFNKLTVLRADRSKVETLDPVFNLKALKEVYVDRTAIHDITAREFLEKNPRCLLVYKTIHLDRWWNELSENWKDVFRSKMGSDTSSSRENLHALVERETFAFSEAPVRNLSAFNEFIRLRKLQFSSTGISEIPPLEAFASLETLHATNSPLQTIGAISQLKQLEELDISNTPIDDLRGLEGLENLKSLHCGGTQIRKLDPLRSLAGLEYLDCSNTAVKKLDPVMYLSLRTLKCYNTKINSRRIETFRENNPECNVVYYR